MRRDRRGGRRRGAAAGRRGSLLVQVLVMGTMMLILAGALMKMILLHFGLTAQTVENLRYRNDAEASLQAVVAGWAAMGQNCTPFDADGGKVSVGGPQCGGADSCACTCTVTITVVDPDTGQEKPTTFPPVKAEGGPSNCTLKVEKEYDPSF